MDGSKNIEAFLRYASKTLKRPTEPSRKKRNNYRSNEVGSTLNNRPTIKLANMTASYQTYKSKSSAIRPPSKITKQWDAPVTLRVPTNSKGIQSLEKLSLNQQKQYKYEKPYPPTKVKKRPKNRKYRNNNSAIKNSETSRGSKFVNNVVETAEYSNTSSPSERIGTNYSTSSLFLTLKTIGDLSAIQQNQDEYKLQIKKRWEMFKQAYVKDSKFFLKIDTSKLPLWTFNMTSQVLDNINDTIKNNFDNKITTTYAYAKYYNGQSFSWKKCEILSYDPITNMYSIEFIDSKKRKQVRSMFLSFVDHESIIETEKRILTAMEEREHTKIVLRFLHFVEMQKDSINMQPPSNLEEEILLKLSFSPSKESKEITNLIFEFRENYYNSQKKAAAIYQLMSPLNDPLRHYLKLPGPLEIRSDNTFGCDSNSFLRSASIRGRDRAGKDATRYLNSRALFMRQGSINAVMQTSYTWYPHFEAVALYETHAFQPRLVSKNKKYENLEVAAIAAIHLAEQPEGGDQVTKKQHKKSLNHIFRRKPLFVLRKQIENSKISLEQFHNLQTYHVDAVIKQMHKLWRNEIINSIQKLHSSKLKFDIYTTKLEHLDARFLKLMKRIYLQMSFQISRLVERSFQEIVTFVKNRSLNKVESTRLIHEYNRKSIANAAPIVTNLETPNGENESYSDGNNELIVLPLLLRIPEKEKIRSNSIYSNASIDDDKGNPDNARELSLGRIVTNSVPLYGSYSRALLNINLEINMESKDTNFIVFNPTLKEIESSFLNTIDSGFNKCKIIEAPAKYILQFVSLNGNNSIFGEFNTQLHEKYKETKDEVRKLLNTQFNQINVIVKLYQEFSSILSIDDDKLLDYLFDECADGYKEKQIVDSRIKTQDHEAQKSFDGYRVGSTPLSVQSEIRRFSAIRDEIMLKSHNKEFIGMFSINFQSIKEIIAAKADGIVKRLTNQVLVYAKKKYLQLLTEYSIINDRLNVPIENEKDVFATRTFLAETPDLVIELKDRHSEISNRIKLLGEFYVNESYECFELYWTLYQWPAKIEKLKDECNFRLLTISRKLQQAISSEQKEVDERVRNIKMEVVKFRKYGDYEKVDYFAGEAAALHGHVENIHDKAIELNEREVNLDSSPTEYMDLEKIMQEFSPYFKLWTTYSDSISDVSTWKTSSFWILNTDEIVEKDKLWTQESSSLLSYFHKERIRDPKNVAEKFQEHVLNFSQHLELICLLKNRALLKRHWVEISNILGYKIEPSQEITLKCIIENESGKKIDALKEILVKANKELDCEVEFDTIREDWHQCNSEIVFVNLFELYILTAFDETFKVTDDLIVRVEKILQSPFCTSVKTDAETLLNEITSLQNILRTCRNFQDKALLLCSLFQQENISSVMAAEARKFTSMLPSWRRIGNEINRQPSLSTICDIPDILEKFKLWYELVEHINSKKDVYLNTKRLICSRLYLLNDEQLVEMMLIQNHVGQVEKYIQNAFPGICKLEKSEVLIEPETDLNENETKNKRNTEEGKQDPAWLICALYGIGDDTLQLNNAINASAQNFPEWLNSLKLEMQASLNNEIFNLETSLEKRILNSSLQIALIHDKILWNRVVEEKIVSNRLSFALKYVNDDIEYLVNCLKDVNSCLHHKQREIQTLLNWKLTARDLVKELDFRKVSSTMEFNWVKHPRYSIHKEVDATSGELVNTLSIAVVEGTVNYGNEFLNAELSTLITPLGDKYIRSMMSSYICCFGNNLYVPEVSRTPSIFDNVAVTLGLPSFKYTCQRSSNIVSLTRYLQGITSSGVWGGIVDYEKLHIHYAATLVLEIRQIMLAKREKKTLFRDFKINPSFHLCMLNRVKALTKTKEINSDFRGFRTLYIAIPDYNMMLKLYLSIYGFVHSTLHININKFFDLYFGSSVNKSSVPFTRHVLYYEIFSVVMIKSKIAGSCNINDAVAKHIYQLIYPTCGKNELIRLKLMLEECFVVEIISLSDSDKEKENILKNCLSLGITPFSSFVERLNILKKYITNSKKPTIIYGREGTGKSMLPKVLYYGKEDSILHIYTSSMTLSHLFGGFVEKPSTWFDGIMSTHLRTNRIRKEDLIIFDTISSTEVIDVLLSSRIKYNSHFLLPSGEKLNVPGTVIIESNDIKHFTPHHLSNASLLYCNTIKSLWQGVCFTWINKYTTKFQNIRQYREFIESLFEWLLPPVVSSFSCNMFFNQSIYATLDIYSGLLDQFFNVTLSSHVENTAVKAHKTKRKSENTSSDKTKDSLEAFFIYSIIWGFGGRYENIKEKESFEQCIRNLVNGSSIGGFSESQVSTNAEEHHFKKSWFGVGEPIQRKSKLALPSQYSIFEIIYSVEKNKWVQGLEITQALPCSSDTHPFFSHIHVQKSKFILQSLMSFDKNFYICGNDRDDRIAILQNITRNNLSGQNVFVAPNHVHNDILYFHTFVEKHIKPYGNKLCKPKDAKYLKIILEDLSFDDDIVAIENITETMRQVQDSNQWYNNKRNSFLQLESLNFAGTFSRQKMYSQSLLRLVSRSAIINVDDLNENMLNGILSQHLVDSLDKRIVTSLCSVTIELYQNIRADTVDSLSMYPTVFSLQRIVETLLSIFRSIDTNISSNIWSCWSHTCARVFRDSIQCSSVYDNCLSTLIEKNSLPLTKTHFFNDKYIFFTSLNNADGSHSTFDENDFVDALESIENQHEHDSNIHFPILGKKKSCLTDAAHLYHVMCDFEENVIFVGEDSLEKAYTISVVANISSRKLINVSSTSELMSVLRKSTDTNLDLFIVYQNINEKDFESTVVKFSDHRWFLDLALQKCDNNIIFVKKLFTYWKKKCRILYSANSFFFKNPAVRRNSRIVFSCNSQQSDSVVAFPESYHGRTFVSRKRAKFDNIFSSIMQVVNDISQYTYDAGPLKYYDFTAEYERIINFYEIYTDIQYNELTLMLKNLQALKESSDKIEAKKEKLDKLIKFAEEQRDIAEEKITSLYFEKSAVNKEISKINDRLKVHREKSDELTTKFHAIMDPIVSQLEHVNVEFSSISHKEEIASLKKLDKPSPQIVLVVEAFCILFGIKPQKSKTDTVSSVDYFEAARKNVFHNSADLLQKILNFDRKGITDEIYAIMLQFYGKKTFVPKAVKRQSKFCALLCKWIRVIVDFSKAMRTAAPVELELRDVSHNLEMASVEMHEYDNKLTTLNEDLSRYSMQAEEFNSRVVHAKENTIILLSNFEKTAIILKSLKSFDKKWKEDLKEIEDIQNCIAGDAIYISTFTTYCNILPSKQRTQLLSAVRAICQSYHINVSKHIDMSLLIDSSNPDKISKDYKIMECGRWSIDDCLLIQEANSCVILVDPFHFAGRMLNSLYSSNDPVDVISIHHIDCEKEIFDDSKLSPLIIQIENIDHDIAIITKLLFNPDTIKENKISRKIFLSTDQPTLSLPEQLFSKFSVVNLVTEDIIQCFLHDSLISLDPVLTKHRSVLFEEQKKASQHLGRTDCRLREILQSPSIDKIYKYSKEIVESVNECTEQSDIINSTKRKLLAFENDLKIWKPIVGAMKHILSFMTNICKFKSVYKYNFHSIKQLFSKTLQQIKKQRHTTGLIERVKKIFIGEIYRYIFPSLIAEDILPITFLYFWELNKSDVQLRLFATIFACDNDNGTSTPINCDSELSASLNRMTWLSRDVSSRIVKLENASLLRGITKALVDKPEEFYALINSNFNDDDFDRVSFFTERFGKTGGEIAPSFQHGERILGKMSLLYCFSGLNTKIKVMLHDWIIHYSKGCKLFNPAEEIFEQSIMLGNSRKPIIIVGDKRRNLMISIRSFAQSKGVLKKLKIYSYTNNNAEKLSEAIANGIDRGNWVVISNIDMASNMFWEYYQISCAVDRSRIDKSFRLILIHPPGQSIPREIVEKCIVHRYNNRLAVHDHLYHLYSIVRESLYEYEVETDSLEQQSKVRDKNFFLKRSLFCLAYFHTRLECELVYMNKSNNTIISDDVFLASHEVLVSVLLNCREEHGNALIKQTIIEGIYENTLAMHEENSDENINLANQLFDQIFVQCNRLTSKFIDPVDPSSRFVSDGRLSDVLIELKRSRVKSDEPEDSFRNFLLRHEDHTADSNVFEILSKNLALM